MFASLEFGLGTLALYQHTPDFAAIKSAVESSCQLSFTPAHLQQILHILPGAYVLEWKKNTRTARRQAREEGGASLQAHRQRLTHCPSVLTLRKQQLPSPYESCEGIEARLNLFVERLNIFLEDQLGAIKKEFSDMNEDELNHALKLVEIEKAELPKIPVEIMADHEKLAFLHLKSSNGQTGTTQKSKTKKMHEEVMAKPVPQTLKSLPEWLIYKVRKNEVYRKGVVDHNTKALKKRMLSSLPHLSDQLQSLVIVTKKSIFLKSEVVCRLAVRAPVKGKVEEQLYMLESMVPEWLTVVLSDGKEFVKISTSCKYSAVKASIRRAISVGA
ncbi:hypothetical protein CCR75_009819 [Bremia lactucae]|uniref:CDT1 Geminin-binding domain-containing protein n=1 Tax=Bremia lactucae TaxID=4779 RepID=A0A976IIU8_BRELC|nr:hypothetical protein CCR75_009819 [Bremia lactucae]